MLLLLFSTRNRAPVLRRCLAAMAALRAPDGGFQIYLVDNGSTDETSEVVQEFKARLPLTGLFAPEPGKNIALNLALDAIGATAASAELIVFCDDDILPEPDWLIRLQAAARQFPDTDLFGGEIRIAWTHPPPAWLETFKPHYGVLFAETQVQPGPCSPEVLWGPNLAMRGALFKDGLRFNPALGPNGTTDYAMGSETELLMRLKAAGYRARIVAAAGVGHIIDGAAVNRDWVFRRAARHGKGVMRRLSDGHAATFLGVPLWVVRGLLGACLSVLARTGTARELALFSVHWHLGATQHTFSWSKRPALRRRDYKTGSLGETLAPPASGL